MKLINRDQDFMNGVQQSKKYVKKHLKQKKMRILDIGCSWGYFLYLAKREVMNVMVWNLIISEGNL